MSKPYTPQDKAAMQLDIVTASAFAGMGIAGTAVALVPATPVLPDDLLIFILGELVLLTGQAFLWIYIDNIDAIVIVDSGPTDGGPPTKDRLGEPAPGTFLSDEEALEQYRRLALARMAGTQGQPGLGPYGLHNVRLSLADVPAMQHAALSRPEFSFALECCLSYASDGVSHARAWLASAIAWDDAKQRGDALAMRLHGSNEGAHRLACRAAVLGFAGVLEDVALRFRQHGRSGPTIAPADIHAFLDAIRQRGLDALPPLELELFEKWGVPRDELTIGLRELAIVKDHLDRGRLELRPISMVDAMFDLASRSRTIVELAESGRRRG